MKKKHFKEPWKKFADKYRKILSPSAPSKGDTEIVEGYLKEILKENKKPDILILGCTINYRKLMAKYGLYHEMADINKEMYKGNTVAVKHLKRKEKLIIANWLDMDLKKRYDLILGDQIISNVPLDKREDLLKNIGKHLKDNGLFITRMYVLPKKQTSKQILDYYRNKKISNRYISEIWWEVVFQWGLSKKRDIAQNHEGYLKMKKAFEKEKGMKKWIKPYENLIPTEKKYWSVVSGSKQENEIKNCFRIIAKKYAKDYRYCETCPTYILKKK